MKTEVKKTAEEMSFEEKRICLAGNRGNYVTVTPFKEHFYVHIRYFQTSASGHLIPTKKGIALTVQEFHDLVRLSSTIDKILDDEATKLEQLTAAAMSAQQIIPQIGKESTEGVKSEEPPKKKARKSKKRITKLRSGNNALPQLPVTTITVDEVEKSDREMAVYRLLQKSYAKAVSREIGKVIKSHCTGCLCDSPEGAFHDACTNMPFEDQVEVCFEEAFSQINEDQVVQNWMGDVLYNFPHDDVDISKFIYKESREKELKANTAWKNELKAIVKGEYPQDASSIYLVN